MRTTNEKILLAILIAIVFVSGNFYGYRWAARKQADLDATYAELLADKDDAEVDLQKQSLDYWTKRRDWIQSHQPALEGGDTGVQVQQFDQFVVKGAGDHHLAITEQGAPDVQHDTAGARVTKTLTVKGSMQGLCEWLADLQKPEAFYDVSSFSLKADEDQKSMICKLQLARYFKEGS